MRATVQFGMFCVRVLQFKNVDIKIQETRVKAWIVFVALYGFFWNLALREEQGLKNVGELDRRIATSYAERERDWRAREEPQRAKRT